MNHIPTKFEEIPMKTLFFKLFVLFDFIVSEAGFSEEWASTSDERSRQRQVEVQANVVNNPNRPTEYRTVTTPPTQTQTQYADQDAEERM